MFQILKLLDSVIAKVRPPVVIVLGSPRQAAELAVHLNLAPVTCYQMDLHQANRLREALVEAGSAAKVATLPDLWDLPAEFNTAIMPIAAYGELALKQDMLEQVFHVLQPGGMLISLSEYEKDQLLPRWHKRLFGKCSQMPGSRAGSIFWSVRTDDHERRRHELNFRARVKEGPPHFFLSRPGVFGYGDLDQGARALLECAEIKPGEAVLDLGCGLGAIGILAADRSGLDAPVTFLDSNVRAISLAEQNARSNGLTRFNAVAADSVAPLAEKSFDIVLANPPYFANAGIAKRFIERSKPLLKPGGRFYLVTKAPNAVAPTMAEVFGEADVYENRGYTVLASEIPENGGLA